jgi:hypothetical protein
MTASWRIDEDDAVHRILFHARHNDLVIVGRAKKPNGLPPDFTEQLLVGCGRPVLIASELRRARSPAPSWSAGKRAPKPRAPSRLQCRSCAKRDE